MKIDGYVPFDPKVAFEQGVTFTYTTDHGDVTILSKMAGKDNVKFRLGMADYESWNSRRKELTTGGKVDREADIRFVGVLYKHLVINWSTTITSEGAEITDTQENFTDLMLSPAVAGLLTAFLRDVNDEKQFRAQTAEEQANFSEASSNGSTSGRQKKSGSDA